jgi:hypothetical protein
VRPQDTGAAGPAPGDLNLAVSLAGQARRARCQPGRHPLETTHASGPQRTAGQDPSTTLLFCTPKDAAMLCRPNLAVKG